MANITGIANGAYSPVFQVDGAQTELVDLLQSMMTGQTQQSTVIYENGGWQIKGSKGITITSSSAGTYTVNIPVGGFVESIQRNFSNAGTEFTSGGNVVLNVNWNTTAFNTSFTNALLPYVTLIDTSGTQRGVNVVSVTVQHGTPTGGTTSTTIAGINGVGLPCRIKVHF